MATINVPEQVFSGFKIIGELSDEQINKLIKYLNDLEIGRFYSDIADDLRDLLKVDGDDLFQTLLSFVTLVSEDGVDLSSLSKNLAESYKELSRSGINTKELNKLKVNLLQILSNFSRLSLTARVREYRVENSNNLREFKFLTDIRLMLPEDNAESDKYGILLHKFYIEYQNSNPLNELHLHVSLDDLVKLKSEIEKAIERDKIFRETFNGNMKLI